MTPPPATTPEPTSAAPDPTAAAAGHVTPRATFGHDNNFDLLRFAMAVLVVFSHCFECALGDGDAHEPLFRLTGGRVSTGGLAVDAFFVISGFLITASWQRSRSALSFVRKRACRIYPAYVAAMVVSGCLVGPLFSCEPGPWLTRPILGHLAKATAVFDEPRYPGAFAANPSPLAIDNPVWTIRYEVACYVLVFALGVTGVLRWRAVVLLAFVAVVLGYATEYGVRLPAFVAGPGYVARRWARLPAFYLAGVVLYLYQDRVSIHAGLAAAAGAALVATLATPSLLTTALVVCGGYLLVWFAYQRWVRLPRFAKRGDFSYGIYLYGFPIQQSLVAMTHDRLAPMVLFALATPLAVVAGAVSWHVVEERFVRSKRSHATTIVQ